MKVANTETDSVLSIVIASWSGEVALRRCLESLLPQAHGAEIIVAFRDVVNPALLTDDRFRNVRFVRAPADASVFQLRSLGVQETRGASIALIEDHCLVSPGWLDVLVNAHSADLMVCGGPIENDSESSAYDWALYFAEYSRFMPPILEGKVTVLSGANICYDRSALWSCRSTWDASFYETDVNSALLNAGHKLHMLPDALVTSRLRMGFIDAMRHLFHGGLHFGNFRKAHSKFKLLWIFALPAIPIVMFCRIVAITASRCPERFVQLVRSLLYLLPLLCAWSLGEAAGYFRNVSRQTVPTRTLEG